MPRSRALCLVVPLAAAVALAAVLLLRTPGAPVPWRPAPVAGGAPVSEPRLTGSARPVGVEAFVLRLARAGDETERLAAEQALVRAAAGDPDLVPRLLALARSDPRSLDALNLRLDDVFQALALLRRPGALALAGLLRDPPPAAGDARDAILVALASMGPEAAPAFPALLELFDGPPAPGRRIRVLDVVRAIGPAVKEMAPRLDALIRPPVDDEVAGAAARALLAVSGPTEEVLATLRAAIEDEDTEARSAVIRALADAGAAAAPMVPLLVSLLEDTESEVRVQSAFALGEIGVASPEVIRRLSWLLLEERRAVQVYVGNALVRLGEPGWKALGEVARSSEHTGDRLVALEALANAKVDLRPWADVLLQVIDGSSESGERSEAVLLLYFLDPPLEPARVLPVIRREIARGHAAAVLLLLAATPGAEAHELLLSFARSGGAETRFAVAEVTKQRAGQTGLARDLVFEALAGTSDARILARGLRILALLRPPLDAGDLPSIAPYLRSEDAYVRSAAIAAIEPMTGPRRTVDAALIAELDDDRNLYAAAWSLARRDASAAEVVPRLIPAIGRAAAKGANAYALVWPLCKLGPRWPGTLAALDREIAAAEARARPTLQSLKKSLVELASR